MRTLRVAPAGSAHAMDISDNLDALPLPGAGYDLSLVSHLREHLIWMRLCGRAEDTIAARRRAVVRLAEHVGHDPATASYQELYRWQVNLLHSRPQPSLVLVRWNTALIRPYFGYLHDHGVRPDNPAALLPLPKAKRGVPRPMAEPKVMAMIADAPPRLLPWLLLAGWSGLRAAEIAQLRVDDFLIDDQGAGWVQVRGKGGRGDLTRNVPVPDWAWPMIVSRLPEHGPAWRRERRRGGRGPEQLGVVTAQHVSQYCNEYLHRIGIPDTLHALRHRVATLALEQTGDLLMVRDLLGHASVSTTQVYTLVSPRRMAVAVSDLPRPDLTLLPGGGRHLHAVTDPDTAHGGTA